MKKILSQKELDNLIGNTEEGMLECFVKLPLGAMSPLIISRQEDDSYFVVYEISGLKEFIPHDELMDSFPIGEAIKERAFYTD